MGFAVDSDDSYLTAAVQQPFLIWSVASFESSLSSRHLRYYTIIGWTELWQQVRCLALPAKGVVRYNEGCGGVGGTAIPLGSQVIACLLSIKKVYLISILRIKLEIDL